MLSTVDIIKAIVEKERASLRAYEAARERVHEPTSRAILDVVINDGQMHLKGLEESGMSGVGEACLLRARARGVSASIKSQDIPDTSTLLDVIALVLEREQLASSTYRAIARDAPDPEVRRLFELLSLEKLNHKHCIEALYDDLVYRED